MLDLFAWSSTGHQLITQAAVVAAIGAIKAAASAGLMQKLRDMYKRLSSFQEGIVSTPVKAGVTIVKGVVGDKLGGVKKSEDVADFGRTTAADADATWDEMRLGWGKRSDEDQLKYLLRSLPYRVVKVDLHAGNIPKAGEMLDKNGQVRHFMRSTDAVTSQQAFDASMQWIRDHCKAAFEKIKAAAGRAGDLIDVRNKAVTDYLSGLDELAMALHTVEDSYAQGHVRRQGGNTNVIREVNRWDDANKEGDAATGKLGHHDYDDPNRKENTEFVDAAKDTTGKVIGCLFLGLEGSAADFATALDKILKERFAYTPQ